jgi:hypothetical protein
MFVGAFEGGPLKDVLAQYERKRALAEGRLFGRRKPKRISYGPVTLVPKIYPPAEIKQLIIRHKLLGEISSKQPFNILRKCHA